MVSVNAATQHDFFKIASAQLVSKVPANAGQDDFFGKLAAFEIHQSHLSKCRWEAKRMRQNRFISRYPLRSKKLLMSDTMSPLFETIELTSHESVVRGGKISFYSENKSDQLFGFAGIGKYSFIFEHSIDCCRE